MRLWDAAKEAFHKNWSPYADSNPDAVAHKSLYERHYCEGFIEGYNQCCKDLTGKTVMEKMKEEGLLP